MIEQINPLVILPTYNEVENLGPMVQAILALEHGFSVLVVDDNSPDGTGQIADALSEEHPEVHVLHRPVKVGLGPAYIAGFEWALAREYTHIFEMDCDFSHDPVDLPRFLDEVKEADLVIGSRYIPGGNTPDWTLKRRIISRGGNLFSRALLGLKTHDCTGGYRCYRREIIERVPWEEICAHGYGFQVGVVFHLERMGARVHEFPITFRDRRIGQSKMSAGIVTEAFTYVLQLAWRRIVPGT
jgi:dolichol-phosphate mannosyltransferase